jgi:hypothetical protein
MNGWQAWSEEDLICSFVHLLSVFKTSGSGGAARFPGALFTSPKRQRGVGCTPRWRLGLVNKAPESVATPRVGVSCFSS